MMHMWFYLNPTEIKDFLFKNWNVTTTGALVWTCFVVAAVVILLEVVKLVQTYLSKRSSVRPSGTSSQSMTEDPLLPSLVVPPTIANYRRKRIKYHLAQSLLHVIQLLMGYFVMLAVMSYNGWISIAVVAASGLGFYVFGAVRFVVTLPVPVRKETRGIETSRSSSEGSGNLQSPASGLFT